MKKTNRSRKFKISKGHIQGFIGGIVLILIILGGVYISKNTDFLFGSTYNNGQVTDSSFNNEVLNSDRPVLVYFWAEWATGGSGFSSISEALDNIKKEYSNYLKVVRINADINTKTAVNYGIKNLPTLAIFDNGDLIDMKVGSQGSFPESSISKWLEEKISWEYHEDPLPNITLNTPTICHVYPAVSQRRCEDIYAPDVCLSELYLLPYKFTLANSIKCDGSSINVSQNNALYALIGNTYGGTFPTNFKLPDLTDKSPLDGLNYYMGNYGYFPIGEHTPSVKNNDFNYYCYQDIATDYFIGQIVLAKNVKEEYKSLMLPCDGRELQVSKYYPLYSLIENRFGGEGEKTFKLPDLSKIETPIKGAKYYMIVDGWYPSRDY